MLGFEAEQASEMFFFGFFFIGKAILMLLHLDSALALLQMLLFPSLKKAKQNEIKRYLTVDCKSVRGRPVNLAFSL